MATRSASLEAAADALYTVFSTYGPGRDFCMFCYSDLEIRTITGTPVHELNADYARKLLWETGDHWQDSDVYRHYLPRILEALGPPESTEDLYPAHLFETLKYHQFEKWPEHERLVVRCFLLVLSEELVFANSADEREWTDGLARLVDAHLQV